MYRTKSIKGFTLAEVLITLTIIGVVAALTIPILLGRTQNTQYATSVKQAMSMLNQALSLSVAQNSVDATSVSTQTDLRNLFMTKLNTSYQGGGANGSVTNGAWPQAGAGSFITQDGLGYDFRCGTNGTSCVCDDNPTDLDPSPTKSNCVIAITINPFKCSTISPASGGAGAGNQTMTAAPNWACQYYYFIVKRLTVVPASNSTYDMTNYALNNNT